MPRGQRKPTTDQPKPKVAQSAEERALDAVRKAFQKYDQTQDRAIEAEKKASELWDETKYLKKVFLHAGSHPDLPDDFDAEQFIADDTGKQSEPEAVSDAADVAVVTTDSPVVAHDQGGEIAQEAAPVDVGETTADEDDPFANLS